MMHPRQGVLRAYMDGELGPAGQAELQAHLEGCPDCREALTSLQLRAQDTRRALDAQLPAEGTRLPSPRLARDRLNQRLNEKETTLMLNRYLNRRYAPAFAILAVLALLVLALAFPPVRAVASNFLGLFRVQQVAVVEVNPANLPEQLGSSNVFEQFVADSVEVQELGEPEIVPDRESASELAGRSIRLPETGSEELQLRIQPGSQVTFDVDLPKVRALLDELGYDHIELSRELDGAEVVLTVPTSVMAGIGPCDFELSAEEFERGSSGRQALDCTLLMQVPSPTIQAPADLNLEEIGTAFLQVMGMTEEEAQKFSSSVDWATTLIIPIPRYSVEYQEIQVDGVEGILLQQDLDRYVPNYMLIWVREGVVYALTGVGDGAVEGAALANSLR